MITIQLAGGVGNQLFQYYVGQYLHLKKKVPVVFHTPSKEKSHPQSSISFFFKEETYLSEQSPLGLVSRGLIKLYKSNHCAKRALLPIIKEYSPERTGMDYLVDKVSRECRVSGYFQTNYYFEYCMKLGVKKPSLLMPSYWYRENQKLFQNEQPAAIHLRFGDYLNHKKTIGNLSELFYLQALENLMERRNYKNVYCFTDDFKKSFVLLQKSKFFKKIRFVEPSNDSNPCESLLLQSKAAGHIISNSTFSWWSANLSAQECVIAPKKWFFGMEDPINLFPKNWFLLESRWEK